MDIAWDSVTEADWQARLDSAGHVGLRQSWGYGAAMQRYGAKVGRAVIGDCAVVQVVARRGIRLIQQGPVWLRPLEDGQKRRILRRLARAGAVTLATPDAPLAGLGLMPLITARTYAEWRLDAHDLRAGLHGKWRNRLLRAEADVRPTLLKDDKSLGFLIAQESVQRRARGYQNLLGEMALNWDRRLVMGWRAAGMVQAGMVFLIHGSSASYHLGWASPMAKQAFAHGPMLWQAGLALRAQGVSCLDLGDVNTEAGAGLARFKLGTGAVARAHGATMLVFPG